MGNFSGGIGPGRVLVFNTMKQSKDFDPAGKYIKTWCPELEGIRSDYIHDPWNMPKSLQNSTGVQIGTQYPTVIKCLKYTNPEVAKKQKRMEVEARKQEKLKFATKVKKEKELSPEEATQALVEKKKAAESSLNSMKDAL